MISNRIVRVRDFDPLLLLSALGLVTLGVLLIYSASMSQFGKPHGFDFGHPVVRQATFAAVGLMMAIIVARIDYRVLGNLSYVLYGLSILALVFVIVAGEATHGSRRWIDIGGTQFQPSEVAKLVLILTLAKYLSDRHESIGSWRVILTSLAIAALPAALVFAQPDLGSALIFAAIWVGMVVAAGIPWKQLMGLVGGFVVIVPFAFIALVSEYQRERIRLWLDPERDPLGAGFQAVQARIGIGSGGIWGKGLTHGSQTQLDYLRTQTTDYVFSVLAEEIGFVGGVILLALFTLLLWRVLRVAELSPDLMGRLVATGIVVFILLQTFINVGVNVGLMPVTGIPLPFVSQGGSSLITLFIGLGILQSILIRHRPLSFRDFYS